MRVPPTVSSNGDIARRWMEMVLGEKFQGDFIAALRTGAALCAIVNKVFKALGMKDHVRVLPSHPSIGRLDAAGSSLLMPANARHASNKPPRGALQNVQAYLSACDLLGVDVDDMFEPDDLLLYKNLERVYRNILALQTVAVSLSTRRSIDERSSLGAKPTFSPISDQGIAFLHDDGFEASPPLIDRVQHMSWPTLLAEYERQLLQRERELALATDPSASDGIGDLASDIWGTEERIRALLLHDDRELAHVPDALHGTLWMLASGADVERRRHAGQYAQLVATAAAANDDNDDDDSDEHSSATEATQQIDVDLFRTVSRADLADWSDAKTQALRRVLVAYATFNPTLGYCQGLNYIVARMLQFVNEEEAFYLLIKMIRVIPEDYYTSMLGLAVDQHVFADLVRLQMPDITDHLTALGGSGVELSLACTEWFLTLFASPCDKDVTVRVWDALFLLGDELLFRVALALMQLEKRALLACEHYGDMLKHLNEIGRDPTDAFALLKRAREQDCVYRARIEDFRAHHRLQLASGIVASAVASEDVTVTSSTGRPSAESKLESKPKRTSKSKKHSLFRHSAAGRMSRTFERIVSEDSLATLALEHPHPAWYYDSAPPMLFERYWGSKESYNQWGTRHVRLIAGTDEPLEQLDRRRLDSDGLTSSFHRASRRVGTASVSELTVTSGNDSGGGAGLERGLARERRSKSTAFIQSTSSSSSTAKQSSGLSNSSSVTQHQLSQSSFGTGPATNTSSGAGSGGNGSGGADDLSQYGRSPRTWIQKLEDWHRELKHQKEKKRAEKRRHKLDSRGDSLLVSTTSTNTNVSVAGAPRSSQLEHRSGTASSQRSRKSLSSSPPPRSASMGHGLHRVSDLHSPVERHTSSGFTAGGRRNNSTISGSSSMSKQLLEPALSRSFSDPFHSPNSVLGRAPWSSHATASTRDGIVDDIDAQILIRSQDANSERFDERIADHAARTRSTRHTRQQQHEPPLWPSSRSTTATLPRASSFQQPKQPYYASATTASERRSLTQATQPMAIASSSRRHARTSDASSSSSMRLSLPSHNARRPPLQYPAAAASTASSNGSSSSNPYDGELSLSPMFSQLRSSALLNEDYDAMPRPYTQPSFRRNLSMPVSNDANAIVSSSSNSHAAQPKWMSRPVGSKRPPTAESARAIRDRAHVVSYLQRKLSDASSLAGSISRSPREHPAHHRGGDTTHRLSAGSSTSSRQSDQMGVSSARSAASGILGLPYRKGSFSFFDKLSTDLEHRLDDLNASYPSSEVDFGAAERHQQLHGYSGSSNYRGGSTHGGGMDDYVDDDDAIGSVTLPLPAKNRVSVLDEWRRRSSFTSFQQQQQQQEQQQYS